MWASTLLSTPPERAHNTFLLPTLFLITLIIFFSLVSFVQFFLHLQISKIKFLKITLPLFVWTTSGWNWTVKIFSFKFWVIAQFEFLVNATVENPVPIFVTWSEWLIHTVFFLSLKKFLVKGELLLQKSSALPNSFFFWKFNFTAKLFCN